jgi:hypothetical protein
MRPLDRPDHAAAERKVGTEPPAIGKHPRIAGVGQVRPDAARSGALGAWLRPWV